MSLIVAAAITISVGFADGHVEIMPIEDYVKGVVPAEVFPSWPDAILDAQAIAARTYALAQQGSPKHKGVDVCTETCCQAYRPKRRTARTDAAVERTAGIVGMHKQTLGIVPTYFSAYCAGHTTGKWGDWLKDVPNCLCAESRKWKIPQGHQNGLCQWGGYYLARSGKSWRQILDTYYDLAWVTSYGEGEPLP